MQRWNFPSDVEGQKQEKKRRRKTNNFSGDPGGGFLQRTEKAVRRGSSVRRPDAASPAGGDISGGWGGREGTL